MLSLFSLYIFSPLLCLSFELASLPGEWLLNWLYRPSRIVSTQFLDFLSSNEICSRNSLKTSLQQLQNRSPRSFVHFRNSQDWRRSLWFAAPWLKLEQQQPSCHLWESGKFWCHCRHNPWSRFGRTFQARPRSRSAGSSATRSSCFVRRPNQWLRDSLLGFRRCFWSPIRREFCCILNWKEISFFFIRQVNVFIYFFKFFFFFIISFSVYFKGFSWPRNIGRLGLCIRLTTLAGWMAGTSWTSCYRLVPAPSLSSPPTRAQRPTRTWPASYSIRRAAPSSSLPSPTPWAVGGLFAIGRRTGTKMSSMLTSTCPWCPGLRRDVCDHWLLQVLTRQRLWMLCQVKFTSKLWKGYRYLKT